MKICLAFVLWFAALIITPKPLYASSSYPTPKLGNCRNTRECYLYCQIPKNTPVCWSYEKYVLNPDVLGETTINLTYPIPELGNCASAQDCFLYCSQPQNQTACADFAKNNGLVKEQDSTGEPPPPEVIEAAKSQLGCDSKESCMAFCNQPVNFEKCQAFAQKYNLKKEPPPDHDGPPPEAMVAAKTELGCDNEQSCMSLCNQSENRERCRQFAKKYGLAKEEKPPDEASKKQMLEEAKKEFGCDSKEVCASFCEKEENKEKCMTFGRKHNIGPQNTTGASPSPQGHGPGGCATEVECRQYCEKHPDECPGFSDRSAQNISPPQSPSGTLHQSNVLPPQKTQPGQYQISGGNGDFLGPGGCKTEAECKAYCEKHRDECPGFPKTQGQISTASQNLPQQSPNQPGTGISNQSQLPQGQSIPTDHQFPPGENQPPQYQLPPNPAGGSPQLPQP